MRGSAALNAILLLALAALIGLHWVVLPDPSRRNYEIFPDMVDSVARNAQAPVPLLADGTAIDLRPPAGSIARGYPPLGYAATPEEAQRAGRELANPMAATDAGVLTRGQFVFANFCAVCHGPAGHGDGPATRRGVPPPPSLLADNAMRMSDGQMFHVVSLGQGNMASYASQVERDDRWKAIVYMRQLQAAGSADPGPEPEAPTPATHTPEPGLPAPPVEGL